MSKYKAKTPEDYEFDTSEYIQLPDLGVRRDPKTGQLFLIDEDVKPEEKKAL